MTAIFTANMFKFPVLNDDSRSDRLDLQRRLAGRFESRFHHKKLAVICANQLRAGLLRQPLDEAALTYLLHQNCIDEVFGPCALSLSVSAVRR